MAKSSTKSVASPRTRRSRTGRRSAAMVFSRRNYVLMLAGVLVVVLGYVIMRMENEVDGLISLYIAPLLILGGYLEIIYAILWRPKEDETPAQESQR